MGLCRTVELYTDLVRDTCASYHHCFNTNQKETTLKSTSCCSAAAALAKKLKVECPIIDGIFRVIHEKAEPLGVSPHLKVHP